MILVSKIVADTIYCVVTGRIDLSIILFIFVGRIVNGCLTGTSIVVNKTVNSCLSGNLTMMRHCHCHKDISLMTYI